MKSGDLSGGIGRLRDVYETLTLAWVDVHSEWRDANSQQFEANYLRPIGVEINRAYNSIQRLSEVLKQAERDCEPW